VRATRDGGGTNRPVKKKLEEVQAEEGQQKE